MKEVSPYSLDLCEGAIGVKLARISRLDGGSSAILICGDMGVIRSEHSLIGIEHKYKRRTWLGIGFCNCEGYATTLSVPSKIFNAHCPYH